MSRRRARTVASAAVLAAVAVVFIVMMIILDAVAPVPRLAISTGLAIATAVGVSLVMWRSPAQITDDSYNDDAEDKVRSCHRIVDEITSQGRSLDSASMKSLVRQISKVVPDLLDRVKEASPSALYSTASQLEGHLRSLSGVVNTYRDVEEHPTYYKQPDEVLLAGEQATRRFLDFAVDSIRLINQGDLAEYRANLETVAPPEMPVLAIEEK
ncbi:hypothetical protein O6R08_07375 [Cutibacterium equinum]|uniref:5-bromo-4-chloroindolyl phosphate hydrolysis protein n=1 Tax=Cutibacterium equinum TaxID=3016342 RepID=A0ABY7QYL2_9ACTN|nr:hypothetical protein [Cutibacterium equinum]WCC79352.1 hypothetical protein O6R08_07375 [Cutibacterium equinum]